MQRPRIKRDPKAMYGKPVIAGTRITVEHILRLLGAGDNVEEIIEDYPPLTVEDIRAAQNYAADYLAHDVASPENSRQGGGCSLTNWNHIRSGC